MHCSDNSSDRTKGAYWEREFCKLAADSGYIFTPLQLGRASSASAYSRISGTWKHLTLPDITVWTYPGQHHEIKHKDPTYNGCFGLEKYRFDALFSFADITKQDVMYTIHNHALNGGTDNKENHLEHWFTANILELNHKQASTQSNGTSWVNGQKKSNIPIYYWNIDLWKPLAEYWKVSEATHG